MLWRIWHCWNDAGDYIARAATAEAAKIEAAQWLGSVVEARDITDALTSHLSQLLQIAREGRRWPDGRWRFVHHRPADAMAAWLGAPQPRRCPHCGCEIEEDTNGAA